MQRLKAILKKLFLPITIMFVPHNSSKPLSMKLPSLWILVMGSLALAGIVYVFSVSASVIENRRMRETLEFYASQFIEIKGTMLALRKSEQEFRRLFSLKKKEDVLERFEPSESGSLEDIETLKRQLSHTMETVREIREYLSSEKSIYEATPKGWPVNGNISSPFGKREHPISGNADFHSGLDLYAEPGTPVRATASGVVLFAGWSGKNGNLVAIEHGHGYSTLCAHNKKILVQQGQVVKRGDIIAYSGSTGSSTGPHLHYEVWKEKRPVNPMPYVLGKK